MASACAQPCETAPRPRAKSKNPRGRPIEPHCCSGFSPVPVARKSLYLADPGASRRRRNLSIWLNALSKSMVKRHRRSRTPAVTGGVSVSCGQQILRRETSKRLPYRDWAVVSVLLQCRERGTGSPAPRTAARPGLERSKESWRGRLVQWEEFQTGHVFRPERRVTVTHRSGHWLGVGSQWFVEEGGACPGQLAFLRQGRGPVVSLFWKSSSSSCVCVWPSGSRFLPLFTLSWQVVERALAVLLASTFLPEIQLL